MQSFRERALVFLAEKQLTLSRRYGQHFLLDEDILHRIAVQGVPDGAKETVVEIGPGVGFLTKELLARTSSYIGVERDARLIPLCAQWCGRDVAIEQADALACDISALSRGPYRVVSNVPYEISTPMLWKFLGEETRRPVSATLLLQKEVVDRICAQAGQMNMLALLCQSAGDVHRVCAVSRHMFVPPPRVESAVVHIEDISPQMRDTDRVMLVLARRSFASPRKKLKSTLGASARVFSDKRPEDLSLVEWRTLADSQ